jgi:hypothetical protein
MKHKNMVACNYSNGGFYIVLYNDVQLFNRDDID